MKEKVEKEHNGYVVIKYVSPNQPGNGAGTNKLMVSEFMVSDIPTGRGKIANPFLQCTPPALITL